MLRAALRRLFGVATIEDRNGVHYYVTWQRPNETVAFRRWRWWDVRDWRPFRADPEGGSPET